MLLGFLIFAMLVLFVLGIFAGGLTAMLTGRAGVGRWPAIVIAGVLPLACFIWVCFILATSGFLHEDPLSDFGLLGPSTRCDLGNGYRLTLTEGRDSGYVHPRDIAPYSGNSGTISAQTVVGVSQLDISGRYILGLACARGSLGCFPGTTPFILDTQTQKRTDFATVDELRAAGSRLGVEVNLEPTSAVFSRHRFTRFDFLAVAWFVGPVSSAWIMLGWWINRLRQQRAKPGAPDSARGFPA